MRLWSLAPQYLDSKGLVALWREALLAQKVLAGETKGYKHHPQLIRFRKTSNPREALSCYLQEIWNESIHRNYHFDKNKILPIDGSYLIPVTKGQVYYEWEHLQKKLRKRDLSAFYALQNIEVPQLHPLFHMIEGEVEEWEITGDSR